MASGLERRIKTFHDERKAGKERVGATTMAQSRTHRHTKYRVVKKKVPYSIFSIIKTTYDIDFFTVKITGKILSLSKF